MRSITVLAVPVVTILGLLLRSNLIRYIGAVLLLLSAGAFLWPLISAETSSLSRSSYVVLFLNYLVSGTLSLLTAAILLFSKQFADEFAKRRDNAPKYIGQLRLLLFGAIVGAMLYATLVDIVNLATSP